MIVKIIFSLHFSVCQDFAELKEKQQGNKVPDFSRLLKFTSRKLKSPTEDVDMAGNTRSVNDDDRGRRSRKLLPESSAALLNESTSRRAKKRRSHEKFGNVVSKPGESKLCVFLFKFYFLQTLKKKLSSNIKTKFQFPHSNYSKTIKKKKKKKKKKNQRKNKEQ